MTQLDAKRADRLAYFLNKAINKAQKRYRLLDDGDRILVAVSGGKDSMSLLDLLHRRRAVSRESYSIVAAHIRTDRHCGRAVSPEWLGAWCAERKIACVIRDIAIAEELEGTPRSRCFRCAWQRRKALFNLTSELGCTKLAFGHHADDYAETVLLNLFYSSRIEGMDANASFFGGELRVIRPLILVEERDITPFARASGYPISGELCPDGLLSRRHRVKGIIRDLEKETHDIKRSIYHAIDRYETAMARATWQQSASATPEGDSDE